MAKYTVQNLTIMQRLIDVMIELGYNSKELSKGMEKEGGVFSIIYNRNPLFDIIISRDGQSSSVELHVVNIGHEHLDKVFTILEELDKKFKDKLEFTFIV